METLMDICENTVQEIEVIYRSKVKPSQRPKITEPSESVELFRKTWDINKIDHIEQFKVMLLNHNNRVLGILAVSNGGLTSTSVDIRYIFGAALKANATRIIAVHNHPSGSLRPSKADLDITLKIKHAGKLLDIELLDHVIITSEGFYSLKEGGHF